MQKHAHCILKSFKAEILTNCIHFVCKTHNGKTRITSCFLLCFNFFIDMHCDVRYGHKCHISNDNFDEFVISD